MPILRALRGKGDFAANIAKQGARAQAAVDDRLTQFAAQSPRQIARAFWPEERQKHLFLAEIALPYTPFWPPI